MGGGAELGVAAQQAPHLSAVLAQQLAQALASGTLQARKLVNVGAQASGQLQRLLVSLGDPAQAKLPRVRNVTLAVRLARHSDNGWHDAALPDDFQEVALLLHMGVNEVMALVKSGPAAVLR